MNAATEHLRPTDDRTLPPAEFAGTAGLREDELQELREYQLLPRLDLAWALALREATRLRADFDLDLFATGLLAGYIRRVHALQDELRAQQAQQAQQRGGAPVYTEVSWTAVQLRRR